MTDAAPEKPKTDDFKEIDLMDDQQIINFDAMDKKILVYEVRGIKYPTYLLIKSLALEAAEHGHAFTFKQDVKCWLDRNGSDNSDDWCWRADCYKIDTKTSREEVGNSHSDYNEREHVKDGNGQYKRDKDGYVYIRKYDAFARAKAISKADRNANEKLLPYDRILKQINLATTNETKSIDASGLNKDNAATEGQIALLSKLGVPREKVPQSKWAASKLIDEIKAKAVTAKPKEPQEAQTPKPTQATAPAQAAAPTAPAQENKDYKISNPHAPISDGQRNYIVNGFGYKGEIPQTMGEASDLIHELKKEAP
jgi:hypothetical protein